MLSKNKTIRPLDILVSLCIDNIAHVKKILKAGAQHNKA